MANLFDPTGRTAIVTGACGLIGRQHCAALAAAGANVVVADLVLYTFVQRFLLKIIVFDYIILPLDRHFAFSKLHLVTGWPVWVQVLFFLVTHDFYIYWFHRWQHHNPVLWRTHEAHHSGKHVDWLDSFSQPATPTPVLLLVAYVGFGLGNVIFLSLAMRHIPTATAYAAWMALAVVGLMLVDSLMLKQPLTLQHLFFTSLIVIGVLGLRRLP